MYNIIKGIEKELIFSIIKTTLELVRVLFLCNERQSMPYAPRPGCRYPLCPNLTEIGSAYCSKHKQPISEYDSKRNRVNSKTYDSTWRRLRRIKLNNNPLCELCLSKGVVVQASQVDHVIPVSLRPELRLVYENLQSLCETCHSKKTREENKIK